MLLVIYHYTCRSIYKSRTTNYIAYTSPNCRGSARQTSLSPGRKSPIGTGRSRSPGYADSTYAAVQAALNKRQLQVCYDVSYHNMILM